MKLYHGSSSEVRLPDVFHSRDKVDFGRGFYTTPIKEQAVNWAMRMKKRALQGVVSVYDFNEKAYEELNVMRFIGYSEEWLDFICKCRAGNDEFLYDIVEGGVANDKVFNTLELFFDGLIDKNEAIKRLRYEEPNLQICFRTQNSIEQYLQFKESDVI